MGSYATVEERGGWEIVGLDGVRLRVGSSLDDDSPVLLLGDLASGLAVLAALDDGTMEPSGSTPDGDPVIDIDEYRVWVENR